MTQDEKDAAYGKAIRQLKEARFELCAARKRLTDWAASAREIIASVEHFVKEPLRRGPDQRPVADYSYHWLNQIEAMTLPDLVHDVFVSANKVQRLEAEVEGFEK